MPSPARSVKKKPSSSRGPERRGRKKGAPRPSSDQILEAAEKLFADQGFADTSLRQLMSAAGVSTTAFYARFRSRDTVLEAIATRFLAELAQEGAEQLMAAKNLEQGFGIGVDVLVAAVQDKRDVVRLLLGEANGSEVVRAALAAAFEQLASLLGGNLERLAAKGVIEPADAQAVGWAVVGAMKIQLERWALFGALETDELHAALRSTAEAMLPMLKRRKR